MRTRTRKDAGTGQQVHRLKDIDVEEVSIVDRAANARKFLVVKSDGGGSEADMAKAGAPVSSDGKGGHTVSKETPTPPAEGTPPSATGTAAPEPAPAATPPVPQMQEPKLQLSPEAKGELAKRITAAKGRLADLEKMLGDAEEVAGLVEVPAAVVTKVSEILVGLAEGETVEKGASPAVVLKGLPQFSSARVGQLQAARDALDVLLGAVAPKPAEAAPAAPGAEPPGEVDVQATVEGIVEKAVSKAFAPLDEKLAKGLLGITAALEQHGTTIAKQAARVDALDRGRGGSQAAPDAGDRTETAKAGEDDDGEAWPLDLAAPDKHAVEKAPKDVRFTR
jgi:hypothetical protein